MQIYTLLSPCKSIPYYPHGMITPPFPVLPIFTTDVLYEKFKMTEKTPLSPFKIKIIT